MKLINFYVDKARCDVPSAPALSVIACTREQLYHIRWLAEALNVQEFLSDPKITFLVRFFLKPSFLPW